MHVTLAEEDVRPKRHDRRVVRLEAFTDEEMAQIAATEVPAEYAHLDDELAQAGSEPAGPV